MGLQFLAKHEARIYALLRIVCGFLFVCHGLQKAFGLFGGSPGEMPALMKWTAVALELGGGTLIMLGLFAAPAAFLCSGMMAVGYFMVHQKMGALPIQNHGELGVLFCWLFLYIAAKGSGIWSIDAARGGGAAAAE